jgi:hypothetical protein
MPREPSDEHAQERLFRPPTKGGLHLGQDGSPWKIRVGGSRSSLGIWRIPPETRRRGDSRHDIIPGTDGQYTYVAYVSVHTEKSIRAEADTYSSGRSNLYDTAMSEKRPPLKPTRRVILIDEDPDVVTIDLFHRENAGALPHSAEPRRSPWRKPLAVRIAQGTGTGRRSHGPFRGPLESDRPGATARRPPPGVFSCQRSGCGPFSSISRSAIPSEAVPSYVRPGPTVTGWD